MRTQKAVATFLSFTSTPTYWVFVFSLALFTMIELSCKTTFSFPSPEGPVGKSATMTDWSHPKAQIKVISFNIEYAIKIDEAIQELRKTKVLQNADILLLQEMDERGTKAIADSLQYNYLYYPATINHNSQNLFGNAILSKWPLVDEKKWVLPHPNPHNDSRRIAIAATIVIDQKKIRVYNIHSETMVLKGAKRLQQHEYIADKIRQLDSVDHIILGGDFNTFHKRDLRRSVALFKSIGLQWANPNVPYTARALKGIIKKRFDHIFTKGFQNIDAGRNDLSVVGDHFPLWVTLEWSN